MTYQKEDAFFARHFPRVHEAPDMKDEGEDACSECWDPTYSLPQELWVHVFSFLVSSDWIAASCVSKEWRLSLTVGQLREVDLTKFNEKKLQHLAARWSSEANRKISDCDPLVYFLKFFDRDCPNLHTLRLPRNIHDRHVPHFPTTIRNLSVRLSTGITDNGIAAVTRRVKEIETLSLSFTAVSDAVLPQLPTSLTSLNLSFTNITDAGVARLPRSLRTLDLASTKISDKGMKALPPNLESLNIRMTKVGNAGLQFLPGSLKVLFLGTKTNITNDGIQKVPHLRSCTIHYK